MKKKFLGKNLTQKDFLGDMPDEYFPRAFGDWMQFDNFDPPFTLAQLKKMEKVGLIEIREEEFRLTLKASAIREKLTKGQ